VNIHDPAHQRAEEDELAAKGITTIEDEEEAKNIVF